MAIYYAYGDALVGSDELRAKVGDGRIQDFQKRVLARSRDASLEFRTGTATAKNVLRSVATTSGRSIGFEPIGIGKPLTVQIRHVYTGKKAEGFWGTKDMLVASAMKSIAMYDAAPRAVNFLEAKTKNNRNFRSVSATSPGTPLVCYSQSLAQSSSVVTVEVMFSSFPKETFGALAQAFSAAAGVPVFAPASGYLVAAGIVTKLLGGLGKSLTDGTPALKRSEEITFVTPGSDPGIAHFALLTSDLVEEEALKDYKVNSKGALARVDDENKLYEGDHPYVVLSLDGRENDDFKDFTPTAATAAQLDKFYNINDGSSQPLGVLVDGLKLYNDMKYREKAGSVADRLQGLDKESKEYQELVAQYQAYVKNIGTKELKPPSIP